MTQRTVTEHDFRMPQFRGAKPEDYEFRADGVLVCKDRWEQAVQSLRALVGIDGREFEIEDVVSKVRLLVEADAGWIQYNADHHDFPENVDVKLNDGSILQNTWFTSEKLFWNASVRIQIPLADVFAWREHQKLAPTE